MIEVTATCGWCQTKVKATLEAPLPSGWAEGSVRNAAGLGEYHTETFCKDKCYEAFTNAEDAVHQASCEAYMTTFLKRMNDARAAQ